MAGDDRAAPEDTRDLTGHRDLTELADLTDLVARQAATIRRLEAALEELDAERQEAETVAAALRAEQALLLAGVALPEVSWRALTAQRLRTRRLGRVVLAARRSLLRRRGEPRA